MQCFKPLHCFKPYEVAVCESAALPDLGAAKEKHPTRKDAQA